MHVRFVLLACGAAFDVFAHKLHETWPPKLRGDELASFQVTRVTSSFMVMAVLEDGVAK